MPNDTSTPAGAPREEPAVEAPSPARPPGRTSSSDPGSAPEARPPAEGDPAVHAEPEFPGVVAAHRRTHRGQ
ncbi:MFS transporter, partial [[Kitasatospora] papulosa]